MSDRCGRRADVPIGCAIHEIDRVAVVIEMGTLNEDDVVNVALGLPRQLRDEHRFGQDADRSPAIFVEQGEIHRVGTVGTPFVEEQEQTVRGTHWGCPCADAERTRRRRDDRVTVELGNVLVPVVLPGFPEVVEIVKDGELHVGMDPMDQRDSTVSQVEDDAVFVVYALGAEHASTARVEVEPLTVVVQTMRADPPWHAIDGRQVRVCHHHVAIITAEQVLHPWILEAVDAVVAGADQDVREVVVDAIDRLEHQYVGDVVEESRSRAKVASIRVAHRAGEEVEPPVVIHQPGVEHRAVAGNGPGRHDRFVSNAAYRMGDPGRRSLVISRLRCLRHRTSSMDSRSADRADTLVLRSGHLPHATVAAEHQP